MNHLDSWCPCSPRVAFLRDDSWQGFVRWGEPSWSSWPCKWESRVKIPRRCKPNVFCRAHISQRVAWHRTSQSADISAGLLFSFFLTSLLHLIPTCGPSECVSPPGPPACPQSLSASLRHATLQFMLQRKKFIHPSPPSSEPCQLRSSLLYLLGELMSPAITETPRNHVVSVSCCVVCSSAHLLANISLLHLPLFRNSRKEKKG